MKLAITRFFLFLLSIILFGCVGVDKIDDTELILEQDMSAIEVDPRNIILFEGESKMFIAQYFNSEGVVEVVEFIITIEDNTIAELTNTYEVKGISKGQTNILVTYGLLQEEILVTVVNDSNDVGLIEPEFISKSLILDEVIDLSAKVYDYAGNDITSSQTLIWKSSKPEVAIIESGNKLRAVNNGFTNVWAEVGNVRSAYCEVEVGGNERNGTFSSLNGYEVTGSVTVMKNGENSINIMLNKDFVADSGPGLYVYLSNEKESASGAIEVGMLKSNTGEQLYTVQAKLFDYQYVLIHCKPFNVPFGTATLD